MDRIRFGTDGVRGPAGVPPIDEQTAYLIGKAAGATLYKSGMAVIARDTRASGAALEAALAKGLAAENLDVMLAGVLPTAALSLATRNAGADLGVMITASHNPASDNGIKLFSGSGGKISDTRQQKIEALLNVAQPVSEVSSNANSGTPTENSSDIADHYRQAIRSQLKGNPLQGLKIIVDCANGAASQLAPELLGEAGSDIIAIHDQPDGNNINLNCGSTYPKSLQDKVKEAAADAGIAFDGDADRVLLVDEKGELIDGDQILASLATDWQKKDQLSGGNVVATVMSNMGLERYLSQNQITLHRTPVGDRHVSARMKELGANLGGEQSGHILLPDLMPSGDGLLAGLLPLLLLAASDMPASQVLRPFTPLPQILHNVRHGGGNPLQEPQVKQVIRRTVQTMGDKGRVLVRASGTEPLIRIMAEAESKGMAQDAIDQIAGAIARAV